MITDTIIIKKKTLKDKYKNLHLLSLQMLINYTISYVDVDF